jgi:hypothetical protein
MSSTYAGYSVGFSIVNVASRAFTLLASALLLYSGVVHANQPYFFMHSIGSYQLLPHWLIGILGYFLPYLQIVLAVCLCFGMFAKSAYTITALLASAFILAQSSVLIRGLDIECGCFGYLSSNVSLNSLIVPVFILGAYILDYCVNRCTLGEVPMLVRDKHSSSGR